MTKPLLPTLKVKKRYVVYQALSDKAIKHNQIVRAITNSYKECFGIFGLAKAGLTDMKIHKKNRGILKINHKYVDKLRVSMSYIKKINNNEIILQTIGVSGILKKAKNKYLISIAE